MLDSSAGSVNTKSSRSRSAFSQKAAENLKNLDILLSDDTNNPASKKCCVRYSSTIIMPISRVALGNSAFHQAGLQYNPILPVLLGLKYHQHSPLLHSTCEETKQCCSLQLCLCPFACPRTCRHCAKLECSSVHPQWACRTEKVMNTNQGKARDSHLCHCWYPRR